MQQIREINQFATGRLEPDRTLLLRIAPAAGRARQRERALQPVRLERESVRFFEVVAAAYDELASTEPLRVHTLDASQPADQVLDAALVALEDLLPAAASRGRSP